MTQNLNGMRPNVPKKNSKLTAGGCFTCRPVSRKYWVFGCGAFWLVLAIVVGLTWPIGTTFLLHKELQIDNGSMGFDNWIVMPNDMFMRFMMFNWTNPEEIHEPDYKPNFVEMGPYVFLEKHVRVNVSINPENGTVSYDQIRTYFFMPEMSNGTLDDKITNINVVAASLAYTLRGETGRAILWSADKLLKLYRVKLAVTKTVGELLFDGYSDAFFTVLKKLPIKNKPPFDKFGYFVDRNGSWSYDGHLEMHSGKNDVKQLGMLTQWNYVHKTRFQKTNSKCSEVYGTTGEPWPLDINATGEITVFIMDICRPVTLIYDKEYIHNDVKGIRWVVDDRVFDNGDKYEQNKCYCTGDVCPDLHSGVQNVSDCRFGGPIFTSFPHFYLGDDYYLNSMTGMNPDRSKHEFSLTLEPKTGTPLRTDAKLQINILIEPNKKLSLFEKIPKLMIPAFWFAQTIDLNEELSKKAKIASELPSYGTYVAIAISGISAILLLSGTILTCTKSWAVDKKMNN